MTEQAGVVFAFRLDGQGGGKEIDWDEVRRWQPGGELVWAHLDYENPVAREWILEECQIDPVIAEALLAEETRPRCVPSRDGLLLILRGVNLNPGADPEDMVSIRFWIERDRIITMRHRRLMAVQDMRTEIESGDGPRDAGEFLVEICHQLLVRMAPVLGDLDDSVDSLEDEILTAESYQLRTKIGELRRLAIGLRRYLAPQREVMSRLQNERVSWLSELYRNRLREIADRVTRYVEDLDAARDRAAVCQDELNNRLAEQMNKTMYVVSIVAAIFLPLGLLTGLLGINVGGIPGTESPWAFGMVCGFLVVIAAMQIWLFRRVKWI
jgi:zinc transporter